MTTTTTHTPELHTLTSTKGAQTGTLATLVAWQREHQAAWCEIDGVSVDHIDFGVESIDEDVAAVLRALSAADDAGYDANPPLRVRTAPHITGEDADAGVVYLTRADFEAAQAEGREVAVAWDSGVKTWTPARDLVVE